MQVTIYYDGDCPFCANYVSYLRLREVAGTPILVDLRHDATARSTLEAEGFDLDKGMVADIDGRRYGGSDALNALALMSTRSGIFNRLAALTFSSPTVASVVYPFLRAGRNTTLVLLGRDPLRAADDAWQSLFKVFSLVFAFFAIIHFFIYAFKYTAFQIYPSTWMILAAGTALFLYPGSKRWFVLLIAAMAVDAWQHAPVFSNHTILKNFLLLTLLLAGGWHLLRGSRWSEFFRDVVPVGRVLLLVMYFYGVFHKINEGFLDPEVSCAAALWEVMPWPIHAFDTPFTQHLTIYGTFAVETIIAMMLIVPRFRGWGIVLGIAFHGFLALSAFAMYPAFSTLTVALHVLFLSPDQARRIANGDNFSSLTRFLQSWRGLLLLALWMPGIAVLAIEGNFTLVAVMWLLLAMPVFATLLLPGDTGPLAASASGPGRASLFLWSRLGWLNLVGVLFFLNCAMPYLGLKTAQSMNMFANLRVEGGVNNHLVMKWMPMPFGYLDDVVALRTAKGEPIRDGRTGAEIGAVYYQLLNNLERSPQMKVNFVRDGVFYENQNAQTLAADIDATLHPQWFRKWFHFHSVALLDKPPC